MLLGPTPLALALALAWLASPAAAYGLYNDTTLAAATQTQTAADGTYTGWGAYDPTVLTVPALPENVPKEVGITVPQDLAGVDAAGLKASIPQKGNFLGFSIELSVVGSLMGSSGELLRPIFLNYVNNIRLRSKSGAVIRVGGNTQESSTLVTELVAVTEKFKEEDTTTPIINYSPNLFYLMANISSMVEIDWFFGLAFNESTVQERSSNVPLAVHWAQSILGARLRGLSLGNEPDLYADHVKRASDYNVEQYSTEFADMRSLITSDGDLPSQLKVVGPSVCCNVPNFEIWDVMNSNWLTDNGEYVHTVTVQHYPTNNCKINGNIIDPETIFSSLFLTHESAINLTAPYIDTANQVVAQGKEMVMLEFNTASCGGFAGLSDSFGAALWMADWALQLAWGNFSNALMHVGGQSVYYNPFTPPPYAYTGAGWTTGSVYYSSLVIAEALGSTNTSQVVDYSQDRADDSHPAYLIYENGSPARVVLFNYLSDTTGAADYVATIQVPGLNIDHVTVRYLSAPTISEQYDIYWGNLTMGKSFEGDGRLHGTDVTSVFGCTDNACNVNVPGPSIALVFLTEDAMSEVAPDPAQDVAFSTTVLDVNGVAVNKTAAESGNGSPDWTSLYNGGGSLEIGLALVSAAVVMTLVIGW